MSFKISPLILFLILLIVLVVSVIFGKLLNLEGFVSFAQSKNSSETIKIPQYSSTTNVYKLYDNIFVDNNNANLIEVDSTTYGNSTSGNTDLTGTSITNVYVTSRDADTKSYASVVTNGVVTAVNTDKSLLTTKSRAYNSFSYQTQSINTDKYSVLYIPWDTNTYIHVIDNTTNTNKGTFLFGSGSVMDQILYTNSVISITNSVADTDPDINKLVKDTVYEPNRYLYKLSANVKYDISNSNLVIQQSDSSRTIYDRSNRPYTISSGNVSEAAKSVIAANTVTNVGYNSWVVFDSVGQKMVLYCSSGTNTIVAIVNYNSTTKQYYLANVARFNSTNLDNGNANYVIPIGGGSCSSASSTASTTSSTTSGSIPSLPGQGVDSYISEYFKWYWFWKNSSGSSLTNPNDQFSEDYILKTQIVPPVCPSCPSCPSCSTGTTGGVCANCGGNGGSGTLTTNGNTVVPDTIKDKNIVSTAVGGAVDLGKDAVGGAVGLTKDTVKGAVGLTKETVGGAVGLTKDAVGGAVDLTKETVGGAVGLVKDTVGGAVGFAKDVLKPNPMYIGQPTNTYGTQVGQTTNSNGAQIGQPTYGTQTRNADIYSYYGALPSKSSNFMPITADFSSFGR
uniref:Uncharacterized protein n=1 Tax=viral metagenome TaxID=1070528 RepID=A0A6C0KEW0_9ZZZZ